jgi:RNA polymerase sigma-70 factor (ECF subfamily)
MVMRGQLTGPSCVVLTAPSSFAQAYRDYAPRVARWAIRLGGVDCDVEDIVQEVFLVVSRKLPSIRADGNFTAWLFQVTRKVTANQRRRAWWRRLWTGDEELEQMQWPGPGPEADLERRRAVLLFHRALGRLPEKQRIVFALYELEGMTTAEIAALVRRNLSTVKVQLLRARERFMAVYGKLLRSEHDNDDGAISKLARRVVTADAQPAARIGKKTS